MGNKMKVVAALLLALLVAVEARKKNQANLPLWRIDGTDAGNVAVYSLDDPQADDIECLGQGLLKPALENTQPLSDVVNKWGNSYWYVSGYSKKRKDIRRCQRKVSATFSASSIRLTVPVLSWRAAPRS